MARSPEQIRHDLLVLCAQRGEREAIAELVRLWQPRLWHLALAKLNDEEAAWDATQDAWLSMLRGLSRLRQPEAFGGWAMKIVANACGARLRGSRRQAGVIDSVKSAGNGRPLAADSPFDHRLLATLPEPQLEVLIMYYWQRTPVSGIAEMLNVPTGTVKSRLYHTRMNLKQLIRIGDEP